jgi:3-oxoadipate enol-lactonase
MDSQIPTLIAAGYRCLVFDNRDVGQTEASAATASTIRQFAVDAAGLITQLAFGPAHILGASMGGMIVQELALQYPELVRILTLVCSTGETDALLRELVISWQTARSQFSTSEFYQAFALWLFTHRFYDAPEAMQSFKQKLAANPFPQSVASFQRQCDAVLSFSALDRLSAITAPTQIIVGAEDILTAPRHSQALARQIAGSKLTMLPD